MIVILFRKEISENYVDDEEDDDDNSIRAKADNLGIDVGNLGKAAPPPQPDEFDEEEEPADILSDYDDDNNIAENEEYQDSENVTDEQIIAEIKNMSRVESDLDLDALDSSVDSDIDADDFDSLKLPALNKKEDEE